MPTYTLDIIATWRGKDVEDDISDLADEVNHLKSATTGGVQEGLTGLWGGIGRVATVTAGILAADLFRKVADGIKDMGRQAFDAISFYDSLEKSLGFLVARQISNAAVSDIMLTVGWKKIEMTEAETKQYEKLGPLIEEETKKRDTLRKSIDDQVIKIGNLAKSVGPMSKEYQQAVTDLDNMNKAYDKVNRDIDTHKAQYDELKHKLEDYEPIQQRIITGAISQSKAFAEALPIVADLINKISDLGLLSPFTTETVGRIYQVFLGYDLTRETALDLTKALVNLGAVQGDDNETLFRAAVALAQMHAAGKLTGEEMRQLRNAGIGVTIMAAAMNMSVEEFNRLQADGKIKSDDLIAGLIAMSNKDFPNAAKDLAFSFRNWGNTIEDIADRVFRELFTPALKDLEPVAAALFNTIINSIPKFTEWGKILGDFVAKTIRDLTLDVKLLQMAGGDVDLAAKWNSWSPGFTLLVKAIMGTIALLRDHLNDIINAAKTIGVIFAAGLGILFITGLIAVLTNPVTLLAAAVVALGMAWQSNFLGIKDKTMEVVNVIKTEFPDLDKWIKIILEALGRIALMIGATLVAAIVAIMTALGPFITMIGETLKGAADIAYYAIKLWTDLMNGDFNAAIGDASHIVGSFVNTALQLFGGLINTVLSLIQGFVVSILHQLGLIAGDEQLLDWSNRVNQWFTDLKSWVTTAISTTVADVVASFAYLLHILVGPNGHVRNLSEVITQIFQDLYMDLVGHSIIPEMISAIVAVFASLPGKVGTILTSWASELLTAGQNLMSNLLKGIQNGIGAVVSTIQDAVGGVINSVMPGGTSSTAPGTVGASSSIFRGMIGNGSATGGTGTSAGRTNTASTGRASTTGTSDESTIVRTHPKALREMLSKMGLTSLDQLRPNEKSWILAQLRWIPAEPVFTMNEDGSLTDNETGQTITVPTAMNPMGGNAGPLPNPVDRNASAGGISSSSSSSVVNNFNMSISSNNVNLPNVVKDFRLMQRMAEAV